MKNQPKTGEEMKTKIKNIEEAQEGERENK